MLELTSLIAVLCSGHDFGGHNECYDYLNKCYAENLKSPDFDKYAKEFKKAVALVSCMEKGGYK